MAPLIPPPIMKQYHIPEEHRTERFQEIYQTYEAANAAFHAKPCKATATALAATRSDVVGMPYMDCLNEAGRKAVRATRRALVSDIRSIASDLS